MAVAETRKMAEKGDGDGGKPAWLSEALNWTPRKLAELKTFFSEVKTELKKVTWPGREEVYSTTVVVILTTVFFGFYLFFLDLGLSRLFTTLLKR
jgi:preprotein translocase subunit SecE